MNATKYQLLLTKDSASVVLEEGSKEFLELMLEWYLAHKEFFNGEFSIKAKED